MAEILFSFDVCLSVSVRSGSVNQTSLKRLKLRTSNVACMFPVQSGHGPLKIFQQGASVKIHLAEIYALSRAPSSYYYYYYYYYYYCYLQVIQVNELILLLVSTWTVCYNVVNQHAWIIDSPQLTLQRTITQMTRRAFSVAVPDVWNSLLADTRLFLTV